MSLQPSPYPIRSRNGAAFPFSRVPHTREGPQPPGARRLPRWGTTRLEAPARPTLEITATPCRHGPPLSRPITGDVTGFALRSEGQRHGQLWISGDTVHYTMTGRDGVVLAELLRPHTILPVHYEGWSHFHEGRPGIEAAFAAAPPAVRDALRWLPLGEPEEIEV